MKKVQLITAIALGAVAFLLWLTTGNHAARSIVNGGQLIAKQHVFSAIFEGVIALALTVAAISLTRKYLESRNAKIGVAVAIGLAVGIGFWGGSGTVMVRHQFSHCAIDPSRCD
jgi:hypothetical protein